MTVHRPAPFLLLLLMTLALASASLPTAGHAQIPLDASPPLDPSAWTISCVYCPKSFGSPGEHFLQLDGSGRAHLAYGGDSLYYALRDAGGWHVETIDASRGVGASAALALDPAGQPVIAYLDRVGQAVKYAARQDAGWQLEKIDATGSAAMSLALAVDATGRAHVAYFNTENDEDGNAIVRARYAYRDGTGWHASTIGTAGWQGSISLALSAAGEPHVAYIDENYNLHYTYLAGGGWQTGFEAPAEGDVGVALGSAGKAHLVYFSWNDEWPSRRVLMYTHWDGAGWVTEPVDATRKISSVSLRLDSGGQPHFVGHNPYTDRSSDGLPPLESYAWYGWREESAWRFDAIENNAFSPDFAWGPGGALAVAYFTNGGSLEFAEPGPLGGWSTQTVDRQEALSGPAPVAVDRQGSPQVVFKGQNLYLARLMDSGWHSEPILWPSLSPGTIAIDSRSQPHLGLTDRVIPPAWDPAPYHDGVRYAHLHDNVWQQTWVEYGGRPIIVVDTGDRVHLANMSYHSESLDTKVYYRVDGQSTEIARAYWFDGLAMVIDSHGDPHICAMTDSSHITYHFFDGATWRTESVGPPPEAQRSGLALAIDLGGSPAIAYVERERPDVVRLMLASRGTNGWQVEVVTSSKLDGEPALGFDRWGSAHLVFSVEGRLRHAYRTGVGWREELLDPGVQGGQFLLDVDGRLLVSYIDGLSNDAYLAETQLDHFGAPALFLPLIVR